MNADIIAFIEGGPSIVIASRSAALEPSLVRASGCRVDRDRLTVRVFCSQRASVQLLDDLRANGLIAATFAKPSTHRSVQLKGTDARLFPLDSADEAALQRSKECFAREVALHGFAREYIEVALRIDPGDGIAIEFTPSEAFNQTPGRDAGSHLDVR